MMILPQKFGRNKLRIFNILIYGIILSDASTSSNSRLKNLDGEVECTLSFYFNFSKWFFFVLFKAKAKEKKEKKAGERDDTIPPEYRLTPELVSFSCLHCFVSRALHLTLSFVTEQERTCGKQAKLVFNNGFLLLVISRSLVSFPSFLGMTGFFRHYEQRSELPRSHIPCPRVVLPVSDTKPQCYKIHPFTEVLLGITL